MAHRISQRRSGTIPWVMVWIALALAGTPMAGCAGDPTHDGHAGERGCNAAPRCGCQHEPGAPCGCACCQADRKDPLAPPPTACSCYQDPVEPPDSAALATSSPDRDRHARPVSDSFPVPSWWGRLDLKPPPVVHSLPPLPPDPPPRLSSPH